LAGYTRPPAYDGEYKNRWVFKPEDETPKDKGMKKQLQSVFQIHLSVFLFGFAGLFIKWLPIDAMTLVWGRVLFASLSFVAWFAVIRVNPFKLRVSSPGLLIFLGGMLAFHWWSFFEAIRQSTLALGLFSFAGFPVFTAILEPLILRRSLRIRHLTLAFLSLLGIYIMLPQLDWNSNYAPGVFWGLMSGLSFSVITIFNKKILMNNSRENDALILTFMQNLVAFAFLTVGIIFQPISIEPNNWLLVALLGVVFTAFAHLLFIGALRHVEARNATLIANLEPVYGVVFGILFFNEWPHFQVLAGGFIILSASIISVLQIKKQAVQGNI
jgi:drug/metabolite transporter (DMT)-like permease